MEIQETNNCPKTASYARFDGVYAISGKKKNIVTHVSQRFWGDIKVSIKFLSAFIQKTKTVQQISKQNNMA